MHNRDYIMVMPEEEIRSKVNQYRGWIESERRRGFETYDIEIEYCYLSDELKLREARRRAHDDFMRRMSYRFNGENEYYNNLEDGNN